MGIEFVKAKVARITEDEDTRDLKIRVELIDEDSQVAEPEHDLVVLSVGMLPNYDPTSVFSIEKSDYDGFIDTPTCHFAPAATTRPGVFAAGTAAGPMDIVDSIVSASSAAAEAAAYIKSHVAERSVSHD